MKLRIRIYRKKALSEVADLLHVIALSSIAEAIEQKKIQQQEAKQVGNQQLEAELTMEIINWLDSLSSTNIYLSNIMNRTKRFVHFILISPSDLSVISSVNRK